MNKEKVCSAEEASLKSLFLGPQAENREWVSSQIQLLLQSWFQWRSEFRPADGRAISEADIASPAYRERRAHTEEVLRELAARFEKEIPKFSPRYIGHMFSEISLPSLFGHILTLLHNPNNISGESSRFGVLVEEEAVAALAQMVGFPSQAIGHFTSGGTIANFEAVYRARTRCYSWMSAGVDTPLSVFESSAKGWDRFKEISQTTPESREEFNPFAGNPFAVAARISAKIDRPFLGPVLLVPEHKHYSWTKSANVFGLGAEAFWSVALNEKGHLDVADLREKIYKAQREDRPIVMIVSVVGTTELGMIDPVDEVQNLLDLLKKNHGWHLWHHVDAAYGGFMCSLTGEQAEVREVLSSEGQSALKAVGRVDSITIDPHKLGYVPYSSGAFIAADSRDYYQSSFGAPYVDFSRSVDKGPFTLEGSRSAAGAVATWMASQCVGLSQDGYGRIIARTIRLRREFEAHLQESIPDIYLAPHVDANLLGFCIAKKGESLQTTNERTLRLYHLLNEGPEFSVSKTKLTSRNYKKYFQHLTSSWNAQHDSEELALIRLCIMNPFFKSVEMNVSYQELFVKTVQGCVQTIG
ncbi:MAG: pyridoxal-dependent decarboxylase [Bdellovibrio sp.]